MVGCKKKRVRHSFNQQCSRKFCDLTLSQLIKFDMMEQESRKHYSKEVIHYPQSHARICLLLASQLQNLPRKDKAPSPQQQIGLLYPGKTLSIGVTGFFSLSSGLSSWSNPNKSSLLLRVFHRLSLSRIYSLICSENSLSSSPLSLSLSLSVFLCVRTWRQLLPVPQPPSQVRQY